MSYCSMLLDDVRRAIWCYLIGVTVAAAVGSIPMLIFPFPIVWLVGAMIGLPALLGLFVLLAAFQRSIHTHLRSWCYSLLFLAVLISVAILVSPTRVDGFGVTVIGLTLVGVATAVRVFHERTVDADHQRYWDTEHPGDDRAGAAA